MLGITFRQRAMTPRQASVVAMATIMTLSVVQGAVADPVNILFVGNSYTHGRYDPALNYNAGPANAPGDGVVHDLLCPSSPCSGVEGVAPVVPTSSNTPGGTLPGQLNYL